MEVKGIEASAVRKAVVNELQKEDSIKQKELEKERRDLESGVPSDPRLLAMAVAAENALEEAELARIERSFADVVKAADEANKARELKAAKEKADLQAASDAAEALLARTCKICYGLDCKKAACEYQTNVKTQEYAARSMIEVAKKLPVHRVAPKTKESMETTCRSAPVILDEEATKPVFNSIVHRKGDGEPGVDRFKQPTFSERRKLRKEPLPAVDELVFKLKLEAMFRVRSPELLLQLKNKAMRFLESYDCSHLTNRNIFNIVANAVGEAMNVGQEEADVRQALKNSEQNKETNKQAKLLKEGVVGNVGFGPFKKAVHLPTN